MGRQVAAKAVLASVDVTTIDRERQRLIWSIRLSIVVALPPVDRLRYGRRGSNDIATFPVLLGRQGPPSSTLVVGHECKATNMPTKHKAQGQVCISIGPKRKGSASWRGLKSLCADTGEEGDMSCVSERLGLM
jgi:hypothetical protein